MIDSKIGFASNSDLMLEIELVISVSLVIGIVASFMWVFFPVVNFINILRLAFEPIFFCHKVTKPNCNYRKLVRLVIKSHA